MDKIDSVIRLFKDHIKGTEEKAPVIDKTILLCFMTKAVQKSLGIKSRKVYTTTRIIKHLFDKKPAEEFEFILHHIVEIIMYPEKIYEPPQGKRSNYCFVKRIKNSLYICAIEISNSLDLGGEEMNYAVTCFRDRDEDYLKKYKLFWSWKGGTPSS